MKDENKKKAQLIEELTELRKQIKSLQSRQNSDNHPESKSEENVKYQRILNNSPDIYYNYSTTAGATFWSRQIEDLLGYSSDQLNKNPKLWNESILEEDRTHVYSKINKLKTNDKYEIEYRFRDAKGNIRWLLDRGICVFHSGKKIEVDGVVSDITDKKKIEKKLVDSEEKFRTLYLRTPAMLHLVNEKGEIVDVSDYWLNKMGYSREEVIGKKSFVFLTPESRGKKLLER